MKAVIPLGDWGCLGPNLELEFGLVVLADSSF